MCNLKKKSDEKSVVADFSDYLTEEPVVSTGDMTGAIQAPPADQSEAESYAEIAAIPVAESVYDNKKQDNEKS